MKKLIMVVLVVSGGGYLTYFISSTNVAGYFFECYDALGVTERLKTLQDNQDFKAMESVMHRCLEDRKTSAECLDSFKRRNVIQSVPYDTASIKNDMDQCMWNKMSIIESIFYSKGKVVDNFKISLPATSGK